MLIVALVFLVTWVIPNQITTVLFIKSLGTDNGAALKLRCTMSLGALEEGSASTTKCLAEITVQLNSCLNFFVYAFQHKDFYQHLRLMCGANEHSSQTSTAALSAKANMSSAETRLI